MDQSEESKMAQAVATAKEMAEVQRRFKSKEALYSYLSDRSK